MAATRPLRADASRNRERLLAAARELFAERGLSVTMDEIAARAGVGVGTAYRRFRDRDEIVEALFEARMAEFTALVEDALTDPDPWRGLAGFMERSVAMRAADRGLHDVLAGNDRDLARLARTRERLLPLVERMVARAIEAGAVRSDLSGRDIPLLGLMLGQLADFSKDVAPELWRRYLALVLDGLRARPDAEPLPCRALEAPEVERAMSAWRARRH